MKSLEDIPFLNSLDRALARFFGQRAVSNSEIVALVAALTSYALRQGHVCLDLNSLKSNEFKEFIEENIVDEVFELAKSDSQIGSEKDQTAPLILADGHKLYLHRYWHYEKQLIKLLKARIDEPNRPHTEPNSFPSQISSALSNEQEQAVNRAFNSSLTLISGGPGTGKTTTVLYILAYFAKQSPDKSLKIGLAAPTGKAAQRIQDSLNAGIDKLGLPTEETDKIRIEATTLHRLLGYQRHSSNFIHNCKTPLALDVVIIDEASMLDLLLFTKLLDALRSSTKLILLGDRNQLASVEAGSIFGDIIEARSKNKRLSSKVIELTKNYRFGNDSTLFRVCELIKEGNASEALKRINNDDELRLSTLPKPPFIQRHLHSYLDEHLKTISEATTPEEALNRIAEFCILTPIRKGAYGIEGLNETISFIARQQRGINTRNPYYSGMPIMIAENDYSHNLYNGDVGVVFSPDPSSDELFAFFRDDREPKAKRFTLSSLPKFDIAYATTVHKSQGSEYKHVLFILPPGRSPLLTRELIYTAISRSRKSVEIWGSPEDMEAAIHNKTLRTSGILKAMSAK
jgi:exodeoxyribonuclease V alpha subunit